MNHWHRLRLPCLALAGLVTWQVPSQGQCTRYETEVVRAAGLSASSWFGYRLAEDRSVMVASDPADQKLFVFRRQGGQWIEEAALQPSQPHLFPHAVAVRGSVVAATGEQADGTLTLTVFRHDGVQWQEEHLEILTGAFSDSEDNLAISPDGSAILVGAELTNLVGEAYYYEFQGGNWTRTQTLQASDRKDLDSFGACVDLESGVAVIGAPGTATFGLSKSTVYVFRPDAGGTWSESQQITVATQREFGTSLDLDGNQLLVGAPLDSAVDLFEDGGSGFAFRTSFTSPAVALFGVRVQVAATRLVIGSQSNGAFVFRDDGSGSWPLDHQLQARDFRAGQDVLQIGEEAFVGTYGQGADGIGRYSRNLSLVATPAVVNPADVLTVDTGPGAPGTLALLAVVGVNGMPRFQPLAFRGLGPCGDWTETFVVPAGLSGNTVDLQSFGVDPRGDFAASGTATVTLN